MLIERIWTILYVFFSAVDELAQETKFTVGNDDPTDASVNILGHIWLRYRLMTELRRTTSVGSY